MALGIVEQQRGRPRIADVAREAGESKTAVSSAFNSPERLSADTARRIRVSRVAGGRRMARGPRILAPVADLPFSLAAPVAARLRAAADIEGKLPRALVALGLPAAGDVAVLDDPDDWHVARLRAAGVTARALAFADPFRLDAPDGSVDAIISLWSGFRGVDPAALAEADRALCDGGRLLVVHDYGRDEVSALRPADAPEYTSWSRRQGPFMCGGGFRIRVVHCFWTFPSIEEGRALLSDAFGVQGEALGATLRRPRLSWNLAIYHRVRGGSAPGLDGVAQPGATR